MRLVFSMDHDDDDSSRHQLPVRTEPLKTVYRKTIAITTAVANVNVKIRYAIVVVVVCVVTEILHKTAASEYARTPEQ